MPWALLQHAQEALLLSIAVALPIVGVAAVVGLVVAALQAASQIQDPTIAHLPRLLAVVLLAVVAALAVGAPWMGRQVAAFAERMFLLAAQ
jgi:type III secretory pathway component EscS